MNEERQSAEKTYDLFGVSLQCLIRPTEDNDGISVHRGTLAPGVAVPLHSHPEPEMFYVLSGSVEIYRETQAPDGWTRLHQDQVFTVPRSARHALRNTSDAPCSLIVVSNGTLDDFFREVAVPMIPGKSPLPPTTEQMKRLFATAAVHNYWMGSAEENAAIGVQLPRIP